MTNSDEHAARRPEQVAVLGGGIAGLTAALALTATPALRARYAVTVYQQGWRLGGKCASGRNAAHGQRIEEHGLHMWFGFYENAFALMRRCYRDLDRPPGAPLATVDEAFTPHNAGVLWDGSGSDWTPMELSFPPNDLVPGDGTPIPDFWDMVRRGLTFSWDDWRTLHLDDVVPVKRADWAHDVAQAIGTVLDDVVEIGSHLLLRVARDLAASLADRGRDGRGEREDEASRHLLRRLLEEFREWCWTDVVQPRLDDDRVREFFMRCDAALTMIVGVIDDDVHTRGFDALNGEEFRAWLARHGAQPVTIDGPMIRSCYCGAFAFLDGDTTQPDLAAGVALCWLFRQELGYKGALVWRMNAGMGDAVVAPMYLAARARGVRFELFHRVADVQPSGDGASIGRVSLRRQARIAAGEYDPLVDVKGLACWPSEPRWEQLEHGAALRAQHVDFERGDGPSPEPVELVAGRDFDHVVLAIPVSALPPITTALIADSSRPRFAAMVDGARTVMTQAFQLWMRAPLSDLGWDFPSEISSTYVEPLDTYCDMSQLVPVEAWPSGADVASIAYFCGVLPDSAGDTDATSTARARDAGLAFLRGPIAELWPRARVGGEFAWDLLVAPDDVEGAARFDSQFWRANFPLTERYVLSPAGSIDTRLRAGDSEWTNLVYAGDWVRTGLDLGCVEAAVMSGMQAARAISGEPVTVAGENSDWFTGRSSSTLRRTPSRFTNALLNELRVLGDPVADDVVAQHAAERPAEHPRDLVGDIAAHLEMAPERRSHAIAGYLAEHPPLPEWAEPALLERSAEFFASRGVAIGSALFLASLPQAYASPNGARVLALTAELVTDPVRRVNETARMVFDSLTAGGLVVGTGPGYQDIRRVRIMHAAVRRLILDSPEVEKTAVPNAPAPSWCTRAGVPLSQEQMLGALMTFTVVVLETLDRQGIGYSDADAEAYLHTWSVIGHFLGIRSDLLPIDVAEARELTALIRARDWAPSNDGRLLGEALVGAIRRSIRWPPLRGLPGEALRFYCGPQVAAINGVEHSDWTRVLFGPAQAMLRVVGLADAHSRIARGICSQLSLQLLGEFVKQGQDGRAFPLPRELDQRVKKPIVRFRFF